MNDLFERSMAVAAKILFIIAILAFFLTLIASLAVTFRAMGGGFFAVLTAAVYAGAVPFFGAALLWRLDKLIEKKA